MAEIRRWHIDADDDAIYETVSPTGEWVRYSDHAAEVARLEAELATAKAAVERLSAPVSDDEEHLWAQEINEGTGEWTFSKGSIYQLLVARKEKP